MHCQRNHWQERENKCLGGPSSVHHRDERLLIYLLDTPVRGVWRGRCVFCIFLEENLQGFWFYRDPYIDVYRTVLIVRGSLESWRWGLSTDPGIIRNGSVYIEVWIPIKTKSPVDFLQKIQPHFRANSSRVNLLIMPFCDHHLGGGGGQNI